MPYFSESLRELWQGEQTWAETFFASTGERGSVCRRMLCSPWQSVQTGEFRFPRFRAAAWTLCSYFWSAAGWQREQVSGIRVLLTRARGSSPWRISWLPWQSTQLAALPFPARSATPWTLFS